MGKEGKMSETQRKVVGVLLILAGVIAISSSISSFAVSCFRWFHAGGVLTGLLLAFIGDLLAVNPEEDSID